MGQDKKVEECFWVGVEDGERVARVGKVDRGWEVWPLEMRRLVWRRRVVFGVVVLMTMTIAC